MACARERSGAALIAVRRFGVRPVRVGLLGGSFNPAHCAHRAISLDAIRALALDEVWWLVSPGNPLKADAPDMAPLAVRLASARARAGLARIRVGAPEVAFRTRFTLDTLVALRRRHPATRFIWLMGEDNLAQFDRWRGWRRIARIVPIAVVARPGSRQAARSARATGWLRRFGHPARWAKQWPGWRLPALVMLRFRARATSATALRRTDPGWALRVNDGGRLRRRVDVMI